MMPSKFPSTAIWDEMAELIGCDVPTIKAVFEVEAAGKFYNTSGSMVRRFEPHHFPRKHWPALGFSVKKGQAAWRASLKVGTSARRRMFDLAYNIDAEAATDATSWGAPQIMGFNAEVAGYYSALDMVDAFEQSADEQIRAFVSFVIENNLDTHLRSHNWVAFAAGYNGNGQARVYGAKIESAYRRQSGGRRSSPLLRMGSKGQSVEQMQVQLQQLGFQIDTDGDFGSSTRHVVREFQAAHGLKVDGVAGATTLRTIASALSTNKTREVAGVVVNEITVGQEPIQAPVAERATTVADLRLDTAVKYGSSVLGAGGVTGMLSNLNENSQTILIGGVVVGAIILASLFFLKKRI